MSPGGTGDIALRALPRLAAANGGGASSSATSTRKCSRSAAPARIDHGILAGIEWVCADAEPLPVADRSVDLYTIAFGLRNVTRIDAALAEARRVLKPGGRFLCLEFSPGVSAAAASRYTISTASMSLPLLGQIVTGDREAYTYLVESIRRFPRQSELAEMIARAGLDQVRFRNLTGGVAALHSAWRL